MAAKVKGKAKEGVNAQREEEKGGREGRRAAVKKDKARQGKAKKKTLHAWTLLLLSFHLVQDGPHSATKKPQRTPDTTAGRPFLFLFTLLCHS